MLLAAGRTAVANARQVNAIGSSNPTWLLPSTAAGPAIDIPDISSVENNIHAGIKYLAYLRDTYFDDPEITREHRIDFAIAAYNAGPARINSMRKKAEKLGLDPNQWFSNVEHAARRFIGREPVQYVSNIYIYYIAYRTAYQVVKQKPESDHPDMLGQDGLLQSGRLRPIWSGKNGQG